VLNVKYCIVLNVKYCIVLNVKYCIVLNVKTKDGNMNDCKPLKFQDNYFVIYIYCNVNICCDMLC
jgi:hypothetical protein